MLVAAAVCPHPPLLVPEAMGAAGQPETEIVPDADAGGPALAGTCWPAQHWTGDCAQVDAQVDAQIRRLRAACYAAVHDLAAARPDLIAVVGGGRVTRTCPDSAAGSLRDLGVPFTIGAGEPVLPLSLTVGSWLVRHCLADGAQAPDRITDQADGRPIGPPVVSGTPQPAPPFLIELHEVAQSSSAPACVALGERLAAAAPRVALLAMGDGSARRALGVHGATDPPAERYDSQVAGALAAGDAGVLAGLDQHLADEFGVAGRAAWQVLAGAAAGRRIRGLLRYAAAPLDVSYFVASWLAD